MKHPLSIGLILIIQVILTCYTMGIFTENFWMSYIVFLTFLGGILILFIYVASLASNEIFTPQLKNHLYFTSISLFILILIIIIIMTGTKIFFINDLFVELEHYWKNRENLILIIKNLYNPPSYMITIILITYLIITMIVIINIVSLFIGPLRRLKYE